MQSSHSPSQSITPEIVVVGLDLNDTYPFFDDYVKFSAQAKTDYIILHCKILCNQLSKIHPNAQWIFVGREYWITGKGSDQRSLSPDEKKYFEAEMMALVKKFPQLTMVAGSISSYKPIKDINTLHEIKKRYAEVEETKIEVARFREKNSHWKRHESELDFVISLSNKIGCGYKIENICKIFRHDNVLRHNKIMPYRETDKNPTCRNAIYVPPKSQFKSTLFQINPEKGTPIEFTVEICREHVFNVARSELEKLGKIDTKKKNQLPLFHFLISSGMVNLTKKFAGQYLVHLDNEIRMTVIRDESKPNSNVNIHFYRDNLLKLEPKLRKIYCDYTVQEEKIFDQLTLKISTSITEYESTRYIADRNLFIKNFNKRHAKPCNEDTSEKEDISRLGNRS